MEFLSQKPLYSNEPSTKGFDLSSGNMWIYPENYPLREYQFQIVQSALYHNTLVCLPTGLGKTFVAAVVMYNFWRWYPQGKIVFLAPTKPLVAQQIDACQDVMGIPATETIELTGATDQKKRQIAWLRHRVIFATPQVFQKDLEKNIVPSDRVKCVVVDEAHKALGKHAYCESIRLLTEQNEYFRVLALSATPGGKLDAVQEVVRNLHITHMELRDDTSPDIIPYINERKLDIVLVGLGAELERFKDRYITIMDRHVRPLVENNVLRGFAGNISKGRIFHLHKEWQQKTNKAGNHGQIMKTLTILMTMYHAYELMVRHGLRAFYNFYQNHMDKFWLSDERDLLSLLEEINYYLGPFPDIRPMPDGIIPEIPEDIRFGHNKFQKLKELLLRHFESFDTKEEKTRAIVFVEYRDIVNEVYVLLLQSRPLIRPQKFVGQAGQKQKQQKLALEDFRSNKVNVLISTSVGEEGLDVGEVDLIVCFDISQHSPIRLVQRMGRTGRKRDGHIIVLVTDGKEHQTLKSTISRRDSLNTKVLHSSGIINALHEESPRMVPPEFNPECQKMVMMVVPKAAPTKGKGKKKEPKKPGNRKNSKLPEPSTSNKSGGSQSSLMKFFKKPNDVQPMEVDDDIVPVTINEIPVMSFPTSLVTQTTQQSLKNNSAIKPSEVKLLSSDDCAVEFLTLCTMKKSENEQTPNVETKPNKFLPSYHTVADDNENFFDFEVPNLLILDCLKNLTDCVVPSIMNDNDDEIKSVASDRFDDCNNFYASPQHNIHEDTKFEALLDESSDDDSANANVAEMNEKMVTDDFPTNEPIVDWATSVHGMSFEELLDETSDESKISVNENELEENIKNVISRQSSVNRLDEPGLFEDILDSSSEDSNVDCGPRSANVESKSLESKANFVRDREKKIVTDNEPKKDVEKNVNSGWDNCTSDWDLRMESRMSNVAEKISAMKNRMEQTIYDESKRAKVSKVEIDIYETKKSVGQSIDEEAGGAFEDILNLSSDESETDCSLEMEPDLANSTKKISTTKNPIVHSSHNKSQLKDKEEAKKMIPSSSSFPQVKPDLSKVSSKIFTTEKNVIDRTIDEEAGGAFEDILNLSSDESETDCSLEMEPDLANSTKKISITKNPIVHSSHNKSQLKDKDEATKMIPSSSSFPQIKPDLSKVSSKIFTTEKNVIDRTIDEEAGGAFEDILNLSSDESETDCSLVMEPDLANSTKKISTLKNPIVHSSHNKSQLKGKEEAIKMIPSSSSFPQIKPDLSKVSSKISTTEKNVIDRTIDEEVEGAFEDILNFSSDESETDCSLSFDKPPHEPTKITTTMKNPIDNENSINNKIPKLNENISNSSSNESEIFCNIRKKILSSKNSVHDSDFDSSADLLINQPKITNLTPSQYDRENFHIFRNTTKPSTSKFEKSSNSTQQTSSMLTISQTLREVERINTLKNIDKNIVTKNLHDDDNSEDERSTSPVFPDRPLTSCKRHLVESQQRAKSSQSIIQKSIESDDDIFAIDELDVDSDFETKINFIESTNDQKTISNRKKSLQTIEDKNVVINNYNKKNIFEKELNENKIVENLDKSFGEVSKKKLKLRDWNLSERTTKSVSSSISRSLVSELNLDDCEWNNEEATTSEKRKILETKSTNFIVVDSNDRGNKNRTGLTDKDSLPDTVDLTDCDWSSDDAKQHRTTPIIEKSSINDIVDLTDCDWTDESSKKSIIPSKIVEKSAILSTDSQNSHRNKQQHSEQPKSSSPQNFIVKPAKIQKTDSSLNYKNLHSPTIKKCANYINLDDCDWSSDFETSSTTLLTSPNFRDTSKNGESTRTYDESSMKIDEKIGNKVDGESLKKRKINLSIGKLSSLNIRKNLLKKRNFEKSSIEDGDSDSENDFVVGRVETSLTRRNDSDFFAKPEPVNKSTKPEESSGMSKFRRIVRQPLSVRRNDVNKLSVNELTVFSAPNKYTQHQQQQQQQQRRTTKNGYVGAGRQKSASVDSDLRDKKNKRSKERNRIRVRSEFIDDEAEVSANGDDSTGTSGTDDDLDGFVSYTQHVDDSVDMQAHYMQTVRSPYKNGLFHPRRRPRSPDDDLQIYSQELPDEPNSYLYDSFCVDGDDDNVFEDSATNDEISMLEEIERNLKTKKRKRKQSETARVNAKRRVVTRPTDTSSSEDEFEKLRLQIHDESFTLKKRCV